MYICFGLNDGESIPSKYINYSWYKNAKSKTFQVHFNGGELYEAVSPAYYARLIKTEKNIYIQNENSLNNNDLKFDRNLNSQSNLSDIKTESNVNNYLNTNYYKNEIDSIVKTKKTTKYALSELDDKTINEENNKIKTNFLNLKKSNDSINLVKQLIDKYLYKKENENFYLRITNNDCIYFNFKDINKQSELTTFLKKKLLEYSSSISNCEIMFFYSNYSRNCNAYILAINNKKEVVDILDLDQLIKNSNLKNFVTLFKLKKVKNNINSAYSENNITKLNNDELDKKCFNLFGINKQYFSLKNNYQILTAKVNKLKSSFYLDLVGLKYFGGIINDKSDGFGVLLNQYDDTLYKGFWHLGIPTAYGYVYSNNYSGCHGNCIDGYGKYFWNNGSIWEGRWQNGKKNGQGTSKTQNLHVYSGYWKDDRLNGKIECLFPDNGGTLNLKEFNNGIELKTINSEQINQICISGNCNNGYGTLSLMKNNQLRINNWYNKLPIQGTSIIKFCNESIFLGNIDNLDKFNGFGLYFYPDGDVYAGNWKNSEFNGNGIYLNKDGSIFKGEYLNHLRNGLGSEIYSNNDIYEGNFKNDLKEGSGNYKFNNGDEFIGEWKNGLKNGYGKLIYSSGNITEGLWQNDLLYKSKHQIESEELAENQRLLLIQEEERKLIEKENAEIVKKEKESEKLLKSLLKTAQQQKPKKTNTKESYCYNCGRLIKHGGWKFSSKSNCEVKKVNKDDLTWGDLFGVQIEEEIYCSYEHAVQMCGR